MPANSPVRELPDSPGLLRELGSVRTGAERERLWASLQERDQLRKLADQAKHDRAELDENAAWLAEHFNQPAPEDFDVVLLSTAVAQATAKEREAEKFFKPVIRALTRLLADSDGDLDAEVRQLLRDGIYVLEGWLRQFHGLHEMLARQLAERQAASPKVLRAKPVEGDIDYAELTRETMAKFPKILAALAK